jgi:hypothetical protein
MRANQRRCPLPCLAAMIAFGLRTVAGNDSSLPLRPESIAALPARNPR